MIVSAVIFDNILGTNPSKVFAKFLFIENCPANCEINVSIRFFHKKEAGLN